MQLFEQKLSEVFILKLKSILFSFSFYNYQFYWLSIVTQSVNTRSRLQGDLKTKRTFSQGKMFSSKVLKVVVYVLTYSVRIVIVKNFPLPLQINGFLLNSLLQYNNCHQD